MFVQSRKRKHQQLQLQLAHQQLPNSGTPSSSSAASVSQPNTVSNSTSSMQLTSTAEQTTSEDPVPAASFFRIQGKKSHQCKTCGLQLSSASNRLRHERAKHKPKQLAQGSSRTPIHEAEDAVTMEGDSPQDRFLDETGAASQLPEADEETSHVDAEFGDAAAAVAQAFVSDVEGFRPLLQETELQASCFLFLQWLSQPPLTPCEALVKARRVKCLTQLQPIKSNLRFIFAMLYEKELIQSIDLNELSKLAICQALFEAMSQRGVGSARFHAMFLLIKKVLVYLTSQESTQRRQFLQPTMHESFMFVDSICSDSSYRRKQEARNRAVLGIQASQALTKGQPQRVPTAFQVPQVWSTTSPTATIKPSAQAQAALQQPTNGTTSSSKQKVAALLNQAVASTPPAAHVAEAASSAPELTKAELQEVTKGCLSYLQSSVDAAAASTSSNGTNRANLDRLFMAHLVTATLCLGLAPRSQVLKQLRLGSSFTKEATDGRYWVKMLADMSKNGKPTTFAIPSQLTAAFDFYIETIRPRLIGQLQPSERNHDYIFVKHNGSAPRSDFTSCTNLVTQRLIGRSINAHAFRASVITAFYEAGATQSEMDTLASIMAHDPTTARNFYFRPQFNQAALQANDKMTNLLLAPVCAASTSQPALAAFSPATSTGRDHPASVSTVTVDAQVDASSRATAATPAEAQSPVEPQAPNSTCTNN